LESHRCIRAIDTAVILRCFTHSIVSVHESVRHRAVVRHGEVVDTLAEPVFIGLSLRRAADVPLVRNLAAVNLVVNPLAGLFLAVEEEVVEERRDGVLGNAGVGEGVDLELRGATVEADVAIAAGEGAREGVAVELDAEGEVKFAVGVVFVVVWWVAEVAGSGRGED
jgi:hypothetical protein